MFTTHHVPEQVNEERFLCAVYHHLLFKAQNVPASVANGFPASCRQQSPGITTKDASAKKTSPWSSPSTAKRHVCHQEPKGSSSTQDVPPADSTSPPQNVNQHKKATGPATTPPRGSTAATAPPVGASRFLGYTKVADLMLREFPFLVQVRVSEIPPPDVRQRYFDAPRFFSHIQFQTAAAQGLEEQLKYHKSRAQPAEEHFLDLNYHKSRAQRLENKLIDLTLDKQLNRDAKSGSEDNEREQPQRSSRKRSRKESSSMYTPKAQELEKRLHFEMARAARWEQHATYLEEQWKIHVSVNRSLEISPKRQDEQIRSNTKGKSEGAQYKILKLQGTVEKTKEQLEKTKLQLKNIRKAPTVTFESRFAELKFFHKSNGHTNVPHQMPGLGHWCYDIRAVYRTCMEHNPQLLEDTKMEGLSQLNPDRIKRLGELGFSLDIFDEYFRQLCEYRKRFGHTRVPLKYKGKNTPLGRWCYRIKQLNLKKELPEGQFERLQSIGFHFELQYVRKSFEERLEECRTFKRERGHLNIPKPSQDMDEIERLGKTECSFRQWAAAIRYHCRQLEAGNGEKGRVDSAQKSQLEALGFEWKIAKSGGKRLDNAMDGKEAEDVDQEEMGDEFPEEIYREG
jgi:hypothetical protein